MKSSRWGDVVTIFIVLIFAANYAAVSADDDDNGCKECLFGCSDTGLTDDECRESFCSFNCQNSPPSHKSHRSKAHN